MSLSPSIGSLLCAVAAAAGGGIVGCVSVSYRLINNLVFIHDSALSLAALAMATCLSHFGAVSIFRITCVLSEYTCM